MPQPVTLKKLKLNGSMKTYKTFGEGDGTPCQYFCLENPMNGEAWWTAVHGVTKSQTWLSNFTFTFHFHTLEKDMATHSSVFVWRIPGTEEPGGLLSTGSHRVRHNWNDLAAAAALSIAQRWKQLKYSSTDEWINKRMYIHTMKYYLAKKYK